MTTKPADASDTPRTDAEEGEPVDFESEGQWFWVSAEFARTLERELAAMRAERDALLAELDEASPKRKCDRCGKEFRMHQLIYEEGDELECWPCNDRENARERAALAAQEKP